VGTVVFLYINHLGLLITPVNYSWGGAFVFILARRWWNNNKLLFVVPRRTHIIHVFTFTCSSGVCYSSSCTDAVVLVVRKKIKLLVALLLINKPAGTIALEEGISHSSPDTNASLGVNCARLPSFVFPYFYLARKVGTTSTLIVVILLTFSRFALQL